MSTRMATEKETFTREFELESREVTLTLYQWEVGDVSCVVWDAALVLAKYLDISCKADRQGPNWLRGKKVLELGSGLGCVGMTAACLGADVVMTDLANTLPMLEENIKMNEKHWKHFGGSAKMQELVWGKGVLLGFEPDLIILADCVYYTESIDPLLHTIEKLCGNKKDTYALLSQEERDTPDQIPVWQKFMNALEQRFNIIPIPLSEQHPVYSSSEIHLMKLIKVT